VVQNGSTDDVTTEENMSVARPIPPALRRSSRGGACAVVIVALSAAVALWWLPFAWGSFGTSNQPFFELPTAMNQALQIRRDDPRLTDAQNMRGIIAQDTRRRRGCDDTTTVVEPLSIDCRVDPCGWWADDAFFSTSSLHTEFEPLLAEEYEAQRHNNDDKEEDVLPTANVYRCRDAYATKTKKRGHPQYRSSCGSAADTGHSQWFAYRHAYRRSWVDEFEFDGSDGVYNDFGIVSSSALTPKSADAYRHSSSPSSAVAGLSTQRVVPMWCDPTDRVLVMAPIKKGYGLTNQLLSLAGQFAMAGRTGRIIAVDASEKKMRIPISKLLNLSTSVLPASLRGVVRYCNHTAPSVMHKLMAPHSLQVIDRKQVALRPHKVMAIIDRAFASVASGQRPHLTFIHELYLRYPFEQEGDDQYLPASLFCGFQFVDWIARLGNSVVRGIRTSRRLSYAAWHLRLETSDGVAMRKGRAHTTARHVAEFLETSLMPLLMRKRGGITRVLLCSGALPPDIVAAIMQTGARFGVTFHQKGEFLDGYTFTDFETAGTVKERSGDHWTTPTATDAAAVDVIAMEKADLVVVTTTSSLSALIYAKRCGGHSIHARMRPEPANNGSMRYRPRTDLVLDARRRGCSMNGAVYLYDTYRDGSFTEVRHYPCGYQFHAYLAAPPAAVPRPPPELDVFAFRFRPDSPMFQRHAERNRPPPGETPIPMEQP
jgi:hypothetical protein